MSTVDDVGHPLTYNRHVDSVSSTTELPSSICSKWTRCPDDDTLRCYVRTASHDPAPSSWCSTTTPVDDRIMRLSFGRTRPEKDGSLHFSEQRAPPHPYHRHVAEVLHRVFSSYAAQPLLRLVRYATACYAAVAIISRGARQGSEGTLLDLLPDINMIRSGAGTRTSPVLGARARRSAPARARGRAQRRRAAQQSVCWQLMHI